MAPMTDEDTYFRMAAVELAHRLRQLADRCCQMTNVGGNMSSMNEEEKDTSKNDLNSDIHWLVENDPQLAGAVKEAVRRLLGPGVSSKEQPQSLDLRLKEALVGTIQKK